MTCLITKSVVFVFAVTFLMCHSEEGVTSTPFMSEDHSETLSRSTVTLKDVGAVENSTTISDISTNNTLTVSPTIQKTTASLTEVSETQMATTKTSKESSKMTWQEGVTSTPFITEYHSDNRSGSKVTLKDVGEAVTSTNILNISTTTTLTDLYLLLCEGQNETVFCLNNTVIEIVSASYGYNESNISAREKCDPLARPRSRESGSAFCHQLNSTKILANKCDGSSQCELSATDKDFEDPCPRTAKYLEVSYNCRLVAPTIQGTTASSTDVSETQMATTSTSNGSSKMTWQEGVTSTPFITENHSDTPLRSTVTLKDVGEAENSTTILDISTTTTLTEGVTLTPFNTENHSDNRSGSTVTLKVVGEAENSTTILDISTTTTLTEGVTSAHFNTENHFDTLSGNTVALKDVGEAGNSTTILNIVTTATLTDDTSTPFITQNHSEALSRGTVTVKDVTEAKISTTLHDSSSTTTFPEVYLLLCEGQTTTVVCPNNSIIEIVSASYGYNGSSTSAREECDPRAWWWERGDDNTRCHEQRSGEILTNKCGGSSECEVSATNEVFGDPCSRTRKFLEVFYYCRAETLNEPVTVTPNVPRNRPLAPTISAVVSMNVTNSVNTTGMTEDWSEKTTDRGVPSKYVTASPNVTRGGSTTPATHTFASVNITDGSKDTSSSNDVTDAQLITTTPRNGLNENDGEEVSNSSLLLVIVAVVCALFPVVVVGGFILWRRTRTGKFQVKKGWISQSTEYSMKAMDSTYTSFGGNDKEQATTTA